MKATLRHRLLCEGCDAKSDYIELPGIAGAAVKAALLAHFGWIEDCPACDPPKKGFKRPAAKPKGKRK